MFLRPTLDPFNVLCGKMKKEAIDRLHVLLEIPPQSSINELLFGRLKVEGEQMRRLFIERNRLLYPIYRILDRYAKVRGIDYTVHAGRWYVKIVAATSSRGTSEASGNDDLEDVQVILRQFRMSFLYNARAAGAIQTRKEVGANQR